MYYNLLIKNKKIIYIFYKINKNIYIYKQINKNKLALIK